MKPEHIVLIILLIVGLLILALYADAWDGYNYYMRYQVDDSGLFPDIYGYGWWLK